MKSVRPPIARLSAKAPTGITGFDEITGGGLPHDRTSLLVGRPGESAERVANEVAEVAGKLMRVTLDGEEAVLEVRAKAVLAELVAKQVEKTLLKRITASREGELPRGHKRIRELRGGDAAKPAPKGKTP